MKYQYVFIFRHNTEKTTIISEKDLSKEFKAAWENGTNLTINMDNQETTMIRMTDVVILKSSIIY